MSSEKEIELKNNEKEVSAVIVNFEEDDEQVTMEVDDHEFPEESEVEGSNAADFSDDEVVDFKQAGKAKKKKESSKTPQGEVPVDNEQIAMDGVITTEEELEMEPNENITCGSANAHEAALFDKWEQYMKNKGYVVRQIGDSKENPTEKTATKGICNDKSETTIYDPAVEQESVNSLRNQNRNSSSSEYNTSDENIDCNLSIFQVEPIMKKLNRAAAKMWTQLNTMQSEDATLLGRWAEILEKEASIM